MAKKEIPGSKELKNFWHERILQWKAMGYSGSQAFTKAAEEMGHDDYLKKYDTKTKKCLYVSGAIMSRQNGRERFNFLRRALADELKDDDGIVNLKEKRKILGDIMLDIEESSAARIRAIETDAKLAGEVNDNPTVTIDFGRETLDKIRARNGK